MRNSWIISFAAVCGVGAFVYVLIAKAPTTPFQGRFGTNAASAPELPDDITGLEHYLSQDLRRRGPAWFKLARLYEEADRPEDAVKAWREAAPLRMNATQRARPDDPTPWFEAGWSWWKAGDMDKARPALLEAEKRLSAIPSAKRGQTDWHRLGWARHLVGDEMDARIAWTRARDMLISADEPNGSGDARYNLACCRALLGEKEAALATLEAAVQAGWRRAALTLHDDDFASIRDEARFLELVQKMRDLPREYRFGPG